LATAPCTDLPPVYLPNSKPIPETAKPIGLLVKTPNILSCDLLKSLNTSLKSSSKENLSTDE